MGEVLAAHVVNGEFLPDWHPYEDYRQTHPAIRALGGGSLRIQSHELDYACWIFGPPLSSSPSADSSPPRGEVETASRLVETGSTHRPVQSTSTSMRSVPHAVRARSCSIEAERPGTTTPTGWMSSLGRRAFDPQLRGFRSERDVRDRAAALPGVRQRQRAAARRPPRGRGESARCAGRRALLRTRRAGLSDVA